ncbi:hypothetical protein SAMD00019534_053230 [Acytostelium subglobosum LB1]|uniref:hypothetical protein n=1 Tax=Acytostelium subglobosum LB1 TaxID=1410327 RepID=UPI0006449964|nr:hypothetical protein SAMD00019534_053230 [Acytostelium subglobosum LB1]GAM22148.1 hypothetical protein SAMD00019534_053230 [Acytostelium subglobosum LB1]|eukprot:XP_012755248.1 hypothetical protein SAMD00019534_053230 [Acytostelium subglobosum LB1]
MISSRLRNLLDIAKRLPIPPRAGDGGLQTQHAPWPLPQPSQQLVDELKSAFEQVMISDLSITEKHLPLTRNKLAHLNPAKSPYGLPISYYPLLECSRFTLAVFAMPRGSIIPLHSHPEMLVLSKMLYGSINVDSYERLDDHLSDIPTSTSSTSKQSIITNFKGRITMTPENTTSLLSPRSVLHRFSSPEMPSAVLELLFPPYGQPGSSRYCTYYKEVSGGLPDQPITTLSPINVDDDFSCFYEQDIQPLQDLHQYLTQQYSS